MLLNQTKAAETGEIKDSELRNKFLGKENQPEIAVKTPEEIPTKSPIEIPPISPPITKEEIPIQAQTQQENILKKITNSFGDKIVELKEKYGINSIPEEEKKSVRQGLRTGLQKQTPIPAKNNKETVVNQHLNRINQQNKKNESHTR
ncbi:hypothetical protein [Rickettsia hoogstraalii]|uniref:hypothetical protein n=1 Tax=Rickettsia hoogstraalii TaxID=467174 RepID=UPI00058EADAF|nr:hypothetical protein [Rickettsia hoogstraalii]